MGMFAIQCQLIPGLHLGGSATRFLGNVEVFESWQQTEVALDRQRHVDSVPNEVISPPDWLHVGLESVVGSKLMC